MDKYKTLRRRFGALILDSFVLVPVSLIVSVGLVFAGVGDGYLASILTALIPIIYSILTHYYYGQTVGKVVAKVKVLNESEKPIDFGQAILRSLPQLVPVMFAVSISTADRSEGSAAQFWEQTIYAFSTLFYLIDALVCVMNEKDRSLHDMLAGTIVVRTDV